MISYQDHYAQFLGYNSKQKGNLIVCHSPLRDKLKAHREPLLMSFLNRQQVVISASTDLLGKVRRKVEIFSQRKLSPDVWFKAIDDFIYDEYKIYQIDHYLRMTVNQKEFVNKSKSNRNSITMFDLADKKMLMSEGRLPFRGKKFQEHFWGQIFESTKEGRNMGVVRNGKVLSSVTIEPVECGGGNIAVYTDAKHRKKGYGKMVVSAAVNWCFEHDILPIYYVKSDNVASIALARSLGFKLKNKEIIVSHWPGDAWNKYKVNDQR